MEEGEDERRRDGKKGREGMEGGKEGERSLLTQ